jgi:hypothetical protein
LRGALAAKQSILSLCDGALDCFAEPVIGRRFAPTRWLANDGSGGICPQLQSKFLKATTMSVRIVDVREVTKPIASPIRNAYIDF